MILFFEIPIIALVVIAMLVGSIQIGQILRVIGVIMLIGGAISLLVSFTQEGDAKGKWGAATALLGVQGVIVLLVGIWFGEHSLFEFLFGTGWF